MRIMSFDISSTTIGWAVLDVINSHISLIDCGFYKPIKKGSIFDRLSCTVTDITALAERFQPTQTGIEDIVQYFPGKSSANTIITLALFNRAIGLAFHQRGIPPNLCNVMAIRHAIKLSKALPKKEEIPSLVEKHLGVKLPLHLKKDGSPKAETNDVADAVAVGLYLARQFINEHSRSVSNPGTEGKHRRRGTKKGV